MEPLSGTAAKLDALKWRCIGPPRGGRVVAVAGDPKDRGVFYFGACAAGVWKTIDGGIYWRCVSDGFFGSAAVGAVEVSTGDPNVIYAGTGETAIRLDVSYGDGVYKSTDAGRSWSHLGLRATRFVGRIRIHPGDADIVYVAALGDAFGANEERGVYRSRDGGKTWSKVLYRDANSGAIDLSIDPHNPRILFAALWQTRRSLAPSRNKPLSELPDAPAGPTVVPGDYRVELSTGLQTMTAGFPVVKDPRLSTRPEAYRQQFELLRELTASLGRLNATINTIRRLKNRLALARR